MKPFSSMGLKHENGRLLVLDQTRLPHEEIWLESRSPQDMHDFILDLKVRGAPLIGVAAAAAIAKFAETKPSESELVRAAKFIREARPTAVNLMNAIDRVLKNIADPIGEAEKIYAEDVALCEGMATHGEPLISDGDGILTHCNTGGLATVGVGTALGVIRRAHEKGKRIHVFVDETRPLLQGGRLTTWELKKLGIPFTLICDNMAATVMRSGKVQKIFVGADRIARNGDFANKIGTYSVAVNAKHHGIPFYCVAPYTTVDEACPDGSKIPIEERKPEEVIGTQSLRGSPVFNPAFDVTPHTLLAGTVFDSQVRKWK
jgi:methylthioribose-1-phosphate isomerase